MCHCFGPAILRIFAGLYNPRHLTFIQVSPIKRQTAGKCCGVFSGFNSTLGIQGIQRAGWRTKNSAGFSRCFDSASSCWGLTAPWEDRSSLEPSWPEKSQTVCPWDRLSKEKQEKNSKRPGIAGSLLSPRPSSAETDRTIDYLSVCQGTYHCRLLEKRQTDESEQKRGSSLFESFLALTFRTKRRKKLNDSSDETQGFSMFFSP